MDHLDKNTAEMSVVCPRAWALWSLESFQAWTAPMLVIGRIAEIGKDGLLAHCTSPGETQTIDTTPLYIHRGAVINVTHIDLTHVTMVVKSGNATFGSTTACTLSPATQAVHDLSVTIPRPCGDVLDTLTLCPCPHFDWSAPFPHKSVDAWVEKSLTIEGLPPHLQPIKLNKQFKQALLKQRGSRAFGLPAIRRLAKQKALHRSRPLGDQSYSPTAIFNTALGRVIDLALLALDPSEHLDCACIQEVLRRLRSLNHVHVPQNTFSTAATKTPPTVMTRGIPPTKFNGDKKSPYTVPRTVPRSDTMVGKHMWSMLSLDFDNCFTHLPHELIIECWNTIHATRVSSGFMTAWVSVSIRRVCRPVHAEHVALHHGLHPRTKIRKTGSDGTWSTLKKQYEPY